MGIIKRQGLSSSLLMYGGMVLGFFISIILFPRILGKEIYGFTQWLVFVTSLLSVISLMGLTTTTVRFFPYFRDRERGHQGYLTFLLLATGLGLLITCGLLFWLKPQIIGLFGDERSEQYVERYYYLIPTFLVIWNIFAVLQSYTTALFRPRVPVFFAQIMARLLTLLLIGLFVLEWISTDGFIKLYAVKNGVNILGMLLFLYWIGELHLRLDFSWWKKPIFKKMGAYTAYATFAQIGGEIITRIDVLMIAPLLDFSFSGIYTVFVYIAMAISLPHSGLAAISSPMIAEAWKNEDTDKIREIYKRTALNNLVVGLLLYVGVVANLDNIIAVLGPGFAPGKPVAIFLGLAQVVHLMNGYNATIVIHSKHYRFDLIAKLITALLTFVTNYIFILRFGMVGAAMATTLTIILVNILYQGFVIRKFGMHPFSAATLKILGIGAVTFATGYFLPVVEVHFLLDLLVRSSLMTLVYGSLTLYFGVAPDISDLLKSILIRIKSIFNV